MRKLTIVIALLICAGLLSVWAYGRWFAPVTPRVHIPFAVQHAGAVVTAAFSIHQDLGYDFDLHLGFQEHDAEQRKRVRQIAGSGARRSGVADTGLPIPVHMQVVQFQPSGERVVYEEDRANLQLQGIGADYFDKIIDRISLQPGHYRVTITSLKDIPEMEGVPVSFVIGTYPSVG
jgi:hypothetical protein